MLSDPQVLLEEAGQFEAVGPCAEGDCEIKESIVDADGHGG